MTPSPRKQREKLESDLEMAELTLLHDKDALEQAIGKVTRLEELVGWSQSRIDAIKSQLRALKGFGKEEK